MNNHSIRLITITVVPFAVFAVFLTNRLIIQTSPRSLVKAKTVNNSSNFSTDSTQDDFEQIFAFTNENDREAVVKQTSRQRREGDRNVTLVIHLPESLGQAIGVMAAARVVQNIARSTFSIDIQLVLRIFGSPRGRTTALYLQSCFPNLRRSSTFQDGSILELDERTRQVNEQWNNFTISASLMELPKTKEGVHETLQMLKTLLLERSVASRDLYPSSNSTISIPFLQTNTTFSPMYLLDPSQLDDIRRFLLLDDQKCCSLLPDPDETVLHVRGYRRKKRGAKRAESSIVSPNKTAYELLGHLPNGAKVAIVSPFHSDEYVSTLQDRGLLVRNISQHAIQDFCFLSQSKQELVVEGSSSFAVWAATLNTKAASIRLYRNVPSAVEHQNEQTILNWMPRDSGARIQYVVIEASNSQLVKEQIVSSSTEEKPTPSGSSMPDESTVPLLQTGPVTIVIQLSGEMGNNLAKIATGKGLQLWARREFGIETDLVLRHQDHSKWIRGMKDTKKCFPKFRYWDFELGNGPNYDERLEQQKRWLEGKSALLQLTTARSEDVDESLSTLRTILQTERNFTDLTNSRNITLPFLLADHLALIDLWPDRFYDDYRDFFEFDYKACCKVKPDPDESVFHFRNYATEMPRHFKRFGFEELSPNKTAHELFHKLRPGDKVAITSRFISDPTVRTYFDALTARGIQVRVIEGQTGVEDFCFLMSAKKELVGYAESTYAVWAGYLGNADKVRLYSVDSPARRKGLFSHRLFNHYNWTKPSLQQKVKFELYPAEDAA